MRLKENLHPLLGKEVLKNLQDHGIWRINQLIAKDPEELSRILKLSFSKTVGLQKAITGISGCFAVSALQLYQRQIKTELVISTGASDLDNLLRGGIKSGYVYEVFGPAGAGKTQLCMALAVAMAVKAQKKADENNRTHDASSFNDSDSLNTSQISNSSLVEDDDYDFLPSVLYLDTNNNLSPGRMLELLHHHKPNPRSVHMSRPLMSNDTSSSGPPNVEVLSRIKVASGLTATELETLLSEVVQSIIKRNQRVKRKEGLSRSHLDSPGANNTVNKDESLNSSVGNSLNRSSIYSQGKSWDMNSPVKMVILDSIALPLLPNLALNSMTNTTFASAEKIIHLLHRLSGLGAAVVVVNKSRLIEGEWSPSLGSVLTNLADIRLKVEFIYEGARFDRDENRQCTLMTGRSPTKMCRVKITEAGFVNSPPPENVNH